MTSNGPRLKRDVGEEEDGRERRICDLALVADHTFYKVRLKQLMIL